MKVCFLLHAIINKVANYGLGFENPITNFPKCCPQNGVPQKGAQKGGVPKTPKMGVRTVKYTPIFGGYPPPRFIRVCSPSSPYERYTDKTGVPENDQKWPFLTPPKNPLFWPFLGYPPKTPFFWVFSKPDSQILEAAR